MRPICQSGGEATLQSIKLRDGYTQTMPYSSGQLTSVTDSYSRSLGLSYSSALLTGLTTPDSADPDLRLRLSQRRTAARPSATTPARTSQQTYLYENASYPSALTGITDENGNRYATWSYDGNGRASSASLPAGQFHIRFL